MSEFLTTREVAALLRIKERKVYDLAAKGRIPCSKVTGKLLFPRAEIDFWLERKQSGQLSYIKKNRPAVVLGSHDPLLEWSLRESGCGLASFFDGSLDGIQRFANHEGIACGVHIYDEESGQWNIPYIRRNMGGQNLAVMEWAKRVRGLIIADHCSKPIGSVSDIAGLRLVPRQSGAGSQQLLHQLLNKHNIKEEELTWLASERTESDAIVPLLQDKADIAFGLSGLAQNHGLRFIPLIEERFDIIVNRRFWFEQSWQSFLDFCRTRKFETKAMESPGYDIADLGRIHFNAA